MLEKPDFDTIMRKAKEREGRKLTDLTFVIRTGEASDEPLETRIAANKLVANGISHALFGEGASAVRAHHHEESSNTP